MTRIKRGYIARRRRTKIRLFASSFRGGLKKRALVSAHRDRDRKKTDFRCLWITRINAVNCERGVSYSYSRLIQDLQPYRHLLCIRLYKKIDLPSFLLKKEKNRIYQTQKGK